jgi:CRISPR/Cas system CSM-associated protein Csm2 small subunit
LSENQPSKRSPGGQPGNLNHVYAADWPEGIDLELADAETILRFQAKLAYLILTGAISDRKGGALNNLCAIRLRYFLDAKRMKELETKVDDIVKLLPSEIRKQLEAEGKA